MALALSSAIASIEIPALPHPTAFSQTEAKHPNSRLPISLVGSQGRTSALYISNANCLAWGVKRCKIFSVIFPNLLVFRSEEGAVNLITEGPLSAERCGFCGWVVFVGGGFCGLSLICRLVSFLIVLPSPLPPITILLFTSFLKGFRPWAEFSARVRPRPPDCISPERAPRLHNGPANSPVPTSRRPDRTR